MDLIESLSVKNEQKILLVVLDGLGGLPRNGKTELESASTPNLDALAAKSGLGLLTPVDVGITPGSGPGHMALFGYDPVRCLVGRGVMEVLGVGLNPGPGDLCARGNFATLGADGTISDRRAGRIDTKLCVELCERLQAAISTIEDVKVLVQPGLGHRLVVVFQGPGLGDGLTDSDPQHNRLKPLAVEASGPIAEKSARVANRFIERAAEALRDQDLANFVLLRGLALPPSIPSMCERYKLMPASEL